MPQNHEISAIDPNDPGHEITFPNIWHFYVMDFFEVFFSIWPKLRFQSGQALWIESLLCVGEWNVLCVLSSLRVGDSIRAVKTVIKWEGGWNKISDRNSTEFKPKAFLSQIEHWTGGRKIFQISTLRKALLAILCTIYGIFRWFSFD